MLAAILLTLAAANVPRIDVAFVLDTTGSMGDEIDSGPVAMCFWYSATVLPWLYERSLRRATRPDESRGRRLPMAAGALNEL